MNKATATTLSAFDAFSSLSHQERSSIAGLMILKDFRSGQSLTSVMEDNTDVFFIISGRACAHNLSPSGKQVQYFEYTAGMMCGHLTAIDGKPRQTETIARTPVVAATVTAEVFLQILARYPSVAAVVMRHLTERLRVHMQRIYEFSTETVGARVRLELLRMARDASTNDFANTVRFDRVPTHADIASRISTHREAVTRELKNLERKEVITWRPGNYIVHDVAMLESLTSAAVEYKQAG